MAKGKYVEQPVPVTDRPDELTLDPLPVSKPLAFGFKLTVTDVALLVAP